jgi:hypothetical protein
MLRQVLVVRQAFRMAIDEPRFNFDTPTPPDAPRKVPSSPPMFRLFIAGSPVRPDFNAKRLFKSTSGCRIAAISESGNQSPVFKVSRHYDHKPSKGVL